MRRFVIGRLDRERSVVEVAESLSDVAGHLHLGPTKTYARRHVPPPGFIRDELADFINGRARTPNELVFTAPHGGPLRHGNLYRQRFKLTVALAGLPDALRCHDLRHTYAALCIASTADPYAVMKRMGHSTITVTYDTYGHLFPARDGEITAALERIGTVALAPLSLSDAGMAQCNRAVTDVSPTTWPARESSRPTVAVGCGA